MNSLTKHIASVSIESGTFIEVAKVSGSDSPDKPRQHCAFNRIGDIKMQNRSIVHSFSNAIAGLARLIRTQRNAKIHVAVAVAVIAVSSFVELSHTDWAILILTIGSVVAVEAMNTAVEALVDLVSPDYNDLAKVAKDTAAAAVLLMAIAAIAVGILLLGPPLFDRLFA